LQQMKRASASMRVIAPRFAFPFSHVL